MNRETSFHTAVVLAGTLALNVSAFGDVGELDKYDCHNNSETDDYHCHGSADLAKLGGFVLAGDLRTQVWSTSDNELFMFGGVSVNAEYNYRWLAATVGYHFMPLISNLDGNMQFNDAVVIQGFEVGMKAGPGVGRQGGKVFAVAGWSQSEITDAGDATHNAQLAGYYVGAGAGTNTPSTSLEFTVTYRDPTQVERYLAKVNSFTGTALNLDTRFNVGWRF